MHGHANSDHPILADDARAQDLTRFVDNAHYYHSVNDEIFDILERAMGRQAKPAGLFKPPTADGTLCK